MTTPVDRMAVRYDDIPEGKIPKLILNLSVLEIPCLISRLPSGEAVSSKIDCRRETVIARLSAPVDEGFGFFDRPTAEVRLLVAGLLCRLNTVKSTYELLARTQRLTSLLEAEARLAKVRPFPSDALISYEYFLFKPEVEVLAHGVPRGQGGGTGRSEYARALKRQRCDASSAKDRMCGICFVDLQEGVAVARLTCSHMFHANCLERWLADNSNCPVCWQRVPRQGEAAQRAVHSG